MSRGEGPIGAAKGKQSDTEALCQPPPPSCNPPPPAIPHGGDRHLVTVPPPTFGGDRPDIRGGITRWGVG